MIIEASSCKSLESKFPAEFSHDLFTCRIFADVLSPYTVTKFLPPNTNIKHIVLRIHSCRKFHYE